MTITPLRRLRQLGVSVDLPDPARPTIATCSCCGQPTCSKREFSGSKFVKMDRIHIRHHVSADNNNIINRYCTGQESEYMSS